MLTFQDILERLTTSWHTYFHMVEFRLQKDQKIISLILFAVVPDHRKSLTDSLPALVPELFWLMSKAIDNISKDFDFQSVTEPKEDINLLYLNLEGDFGSYKRTLQVAETGMAFMAIKLCQWR